jgi:tetratricopeptide (TPR) repeat protein
MANRRRTVLLLLAALASAPGRAAGPEEDPAAAWGALQAQARTVSLRGDCAAAAGALESAVPAAEKAFGPSSLQAFTTRTDLVAAYWCAGKRREAERLLSLVREAAGTDRRARAALANALLSTRRIAEAEKVYRRLIEELPSDPHPHVSLAAILEQRHELRGSARLLEQARSLAPNDANIAFQLGRVYRQAGRNQEARELLSELTETCPDCFHVYVELGYATLAGPPQDDPSWPFKKAVELDPDNPEAWHHLAVSYWRRRMTAESESAFRKALELLGPDPDPRMAGWTLSHFSAMYRQAGRTEEIAQLHEMTREIVRRHPRHVFLRLEAAQVAMNAGDSAEGMEHYRFVAQEGDAVQRFKSVMALGRHALGQGDLAEAEKWFKEGLPSIENPSDMRVHTNWRDLGRLYEEQGRREESEAAYRRALSSTRAPGAFFEASVYEDLERLYKAWDRPDKAAEAALRAEAARKAVPAAAFDNAAKTR